MAIGAVGVLLSAVWVVPLVATLSYTTDMRYGTIGEPLSTCKTATPGQCYPDYLFPKYFFDPQGWEPYRWGAYLLIAIAIVAGVGFLRRSTFTMLVLTALCGLAFRFWSELGTHVWNLRLLSFWYLGIHLLMAIGVAELIRGAAGSWAGAGAGRASRHRSTRCPTIPNRPRPVPGFGTETATATATAPASAPACGTRACALDPGSRAARRARGDVGAHRRSSPSARSPTSTTARTSSRTGPSGTTRGTRTSRTRSTARSRGLHLPGKGRSHAADRAG